MKRAIRIILLGLVALVAFIQSRPATFHVERSVTIAASNEAVFAILDDFHHWGAWSPWEKLDPGMTRSYGGAERGVGATYHWSGNDKVGVGSMAITSEQPDSKIGIQLEFLKPFKASNVATFALAPDGAGTKVTWGIDGKNNFISKAMCLFTSMDKMMGPDFERGLGNLKGIAEAGAAPPPADSTAAAATPAK